MCARSLSQDVRVFFSDFRTIPAKLALARDARRELLSCRYISRQCYSTRSNAFSFFARDSGSFRFLTQVFPLFFFAVTDRLSFPFPLMSYKIARRLSLLFILSSFLARNFPPPAPSPFCLYKVVTRFWSFLPCFSPPVPPRLIGLLVLPFSRLSPFLS